MNDKPSVDGTLFGDYDTIIFDLDGTLWDCYSPSGQKLYAFNMVPPYKKQTGNVATDINGNIFRLQVGVSELLAALDEADKNLSIVSAGELQGKPFAAQPSTMLLKLFDIYKYFNYYIVINHDFDKAAYVKPLGKTLFIDDRQEFLENVNQRGDVDVLYRKAFGDWEDLLKPKQALLQFALVRYGNRSNLRL